MSVYIPKGLPAFDLIDKEGLDLKCYDELQHKALRIALLNIMPKKVETENDFIRLLSHSPFDIELVLVRFCSHKSKNTPEEHLRKFYKDFSEIEQTLFDGLIITGAPVENMPFDEVNYWRELQRVFEWSKTNTTSSLFICWAAQAGLYHFYDINKEPLNKKMFGIFEHQVIQPSLAIFKGFDDSFYVPHSRHTTVSTELIKDCKEITLLAESDIAGAYMVKSNLYSHFFITGHSEYAPDALDTEYKRDITKGLPIEIPSNYYKNNDPNSSPIVRWRAHANLLFTNWIQYYVKNNIDSSCKQDK